MRKISALFLIVLFLYISVSSSAQTEQEPNNNAQKANVLPLNDSLTGNISAAGDTDWFTVTTDDDGRLDLTLNNKSKSYDVHLQLFDKNATSLLHDTIIKANTVTTLMTDGRGAGTYFIEASCTNAAGTAVYTIADTLIAAPDKNDPEPNNNRETRSTPINLNDTITGHIGYAYNGKTDNNDYFTFTTAYDGNLIIVFKNTGQFHVISCNLQDSINTGSTGTFIYPGKETSYLSTQGVQAGKYYIWLNTDLLPKPSFSSYSFYVILDSVKHPNDNEPNNLPSQAEPLAVNSEAQGHIEYYYAFSSDSADWYKIILPQDGMLNLKLSNDSLLYFLNLHLYDTDAKTLLRYYDTISYSNSILADGLAAGTYFIKVTAEGYTTHTTYTLQDSLFVYGYPEDSNQENNNSPYLAKDIVAKQLYEGHVGFYNNLQRDTADWWKLNYTDASGNLQFNFNLLPALINGEIKNLRVQLFSDTSFNALYTYILKDSSDIINIPGLQQGVYYIKLSCEDDSNWCAYQFKASYNSVLASSLLSFAGSLQNNTALLKWSTVNEINTKGFTIERSNNGRSFAATGFVNAKKGSSSNAYSFNDNKRVNNIAYYRLKEIDKDGSFSYSSIISLSNTGKAQWYITAENDAKLVLNLKETAKVSIAIISMNGTVIKTIDKGFLQAGNYIIPLNITNQSSGIYSVKILLNDTTETKQFFKR